jgi:hypothetical protein
LKQITLKLWTVYKPHRFAWTEDHLNIFRNSEEFKGFFALVQPYIPHIEEMQHYQSTAVTFVK